jgi:SAM-dependent methyltransferase
MNPINVARTQARRLSRTISGFRTRGYRRRLGWDRDPQFWTRLVREGAALPPCRPDARWRDWANRALVDRTQVEAAAAEVARCGLPPHNDRPKNWDLLVALGAILENTSPADPVLEMGAPRYSRLLPWLALYEYRELDGIDLVFEAEVRDGPIRYRPMDLTATTFPNGSFAAIACLSVVEHGVDIERYLGEAGRLLRPGGVLVTSTDFWCEPVDVTGLEAYGGPVRIFGPEDLAGWLDTAAGHGLEPVRPLDLRCGERVVTWERLGLHYTFANVVLRRR